MDLSEFLKRSRANAPKNNDYPVERRCLNCGKLLENKGDYLYYRRFCSEECKEIYVKGDRD